MQPIDPALHEIFEEEEEIFENIPLDITEIDNVLDELVECLNARDFDRVGPLLDSEAQAPFLGAGSGPDIEEGLSDLLLRDPGLVMTRGDLGLEPIVVAWRYDTETGRYETAGYLAVALTDDSLISQIDYVEDIDDPDDLVVEAPDASELPEWEDWAERDES